MDPNDDLRFRLRGLPPELDPPRDLWPDIANRLTPQRTAARPPRRGRVAGFAIAASLCVAAGLAWQLKAPAPTGAPTTAATTTAATATAATPDESLRAELVRREADALTAEYFAALREFEGAPMPDELEPAIATLDRSAQDIRGAIAADPGSVFLLDQLRRTYSHRLSLTQRAATG